MPGKELQWPQAVEVIRRTVSSGTFIRTIPAKQTQMRRLVSKKIRTQAVIVEGGYYEEEIWTTNNVGRMPLYTK